MKNVLIIIGKLNIGGAERVGRDIGYFADPQRFAVHYLVYGSETGAYEKELEEKGCIIHHMDEPSKGYAAYWRDLTGLIRKYRFDVIHAHTMFSSGWAMLAGRMLGVKTRIAHSHTTKGPGKRRFAKNLYENVMRQVVLRNATHLVGCGKSAGEWFYGAEVFRRRGILIYNGIGLKEFAYDPDARTRIRQQLGIPHRFVIGHVGHLASVKNQSFLLERMPEIRRCRPDALLLLLGDGPDRERLTEKVRTLGLEDAVIFTGNVPNVGEYMSAMDVFAFPSFYEGMPLAMVEAQTNGLPCCISDRIPGDILLTDLVQVLSLEEPEIWVRTLCSANRNQSEDYRRRMEDLGLDTSGMLEKIYSLYEGC